MLYLWNRIIYEECAKQHRKTKLKHNLCWCAGHIDVVPIKRSIYTVRLLLDGHWKRLERFDVKTALPNDSSKFSSKAPFVILACKEGD